MAGYDIGVAGSSSKAVSTPQETAAGTVFNFSSPGASGDFYNLSQTSTADSAASASAKSPGSDQAATFGTTATSSNTLLYASLGVGILAALIGIYALTRH